MDFVIATKNQKKLVELERILRPLGIRAVTAEQLGIELPEAEETGATFEENARLKAESACRAAGLAAVADDSGLEVDALGGRPGVYSARYAGPDATDGQRNEKLLAELKDVPEGQRGARFVSAVCCVLPDGSALTVRGECPGSIAFAPAGSGGFGYDPIFLVDSGKSFGELTAEEKDAVSHRGAALRELSKKLPLFLRERGMQ